MVVTDSIVNLVKQGVDSYFAFALERVPFGQESGFGEHSTKVDTLEPSPDLPKACKLGADASTLSTCIERTR